MKKYIALSMHHYAEGFLDNPDIKKQRLSELSANMATLSRQIAAVDGAISERSACPPETLQDSKFMTGEQKRKVLRQWDRFIQGGFSFHLFTDAIYQHLNLHCGFIAHFNRMGFHSTYWNDDFIAFARQTDMILRPVPGVFINWERFLLSFQCWGEWAGMGANMLHALKAHLSSTQGELENEVIDVFQHDLERLYPLHVAERKRIAEEADTYRSKVVELTTKLDDMDIDSFLEERIDIYKALFPSLNQANFAEARLVSNLC